MIIACSTLLLILPLVHGFSLTDYNLFVQQSSPFGPQLDAVQGVPTFNAPRMGTEATRYGVQQEMCPSGIEPQRSPDGNINRDHYECVPIVGLVHFGNPVKYCCPSRSSFCTRKPAPTLDLATCTKPAITLYFFDTARRKCRPYTVAGCGDKSAMVDELVTWARRLLYLDNDLDQPFLCESSEQCPHAYTCRLDRLFRRQVCCGKSQFDPCPNYRTFVSPFTGGPKTCNPKNKKGDECPTGFLCTTTPTNLFSYCCANIKGVCPSGQKPFIHPLTAKTMKCDPHSYDASCPRGFNCQPMVVGSSVGVLLFEFTLPMRKTNWNSANCPKNTKPFISVATGLPEKCTVGVTTCSHGFQCMNTEVNARVGFCCSPPSSIEFVPPIAPRPRITTTTWAPRSVSYETIEQPEESASRGSEDRSERSLSTTTSPTTPSPIASLEFSKENKSGTGTSIKKKILQVINTLTCPEDFEAMAYPGTSLILHCTRGHHRNDCPGPVQAIDDVLERALCCIHVDDKPEVEQPASVSGSQEVGGFQDRGRRRVGRIFGLVFPFHPFALMVAACSDAACPTFILSRSCTPGSVHMCREESFFCQFNRQFNQYLCCSLYRKAGHKLLYSQLEELQ
ncbi:hypothetical protein M3Y99_00030500 [Aphelenchoides fujianensis]|nr:hypothetical protein M3Y99_00030500 [Aphelenchoides fujianensis]